MALDFTAATITLPDFIRAQQKKHKHATGQLTNVLLCIALGTKIVSRGVARAGLASMLGLSGEINVQGEEVQKLDTYADRVFASALGRSGEFASFVSEERENLWLSKYAGPNSRYVVAFDPLDGSSNIDVNVAIGTIWGIYRRSSTAFPADPNDRSDFFQPGEKQVAAGYTIYGSSTMFVFSSGDGVHGFTLDPTIGEFILTHQDMKMPLEGKIYSCNEGNYAKWSAGVRAYIDSVKTPSEEGAKAYSARYVGSLVADFHRTLLKGGIFLYPADAKNKNGKLRMLYEASPLAFIAEHAGGRASNGRERVLSLVPADIHQRTPLFIGSAKLVEQLESRVKELD